MLSRKKGLVFLLFVSQLIAAGTDLFSQNYNIQTFTTREGISHNDVRAMIVDSSGFMWIATWDGLSRYDGYSFRDYFHKTNDSLSLPYFSVQNLQVDGADNLWLLTDDWKVARYDRYNDNFRRVNHIQENLPVSYRNISVDESGHLWLITEDSLIRYDFANDRFDFYDITRYSGEVMVSNSNTTPTVYNPEQAFLNGRKKTRAYLFLTGTITFCAKYHLHKASMLREFFARTKESCGFQIIPSVVHRSGLTGLYSLPAGSNRTTFLLTSMT